MFEQIPEKGKGSSHTGTQGKSSISRGNSKWKASETEACLVGSRNIKKEDSRLEVRSGVNGEEAGCGALSGLWVLL